MRRGSDPSSSPSRRTSASRLCSWSGASPQTPIGIPRYAPNQPATRTPRRSANTTLLPTRDARRGECGRRTVPCRVPGARVPGGAPSRQRDVPIPEQAVVNQQQRWARRVFRRPSRREDRLQRRVHRRDEPGDRAGILYLKTVDGVGLVRYVPNSQIGVEVRRDLGQRGHRGAASAATAWSVPAAIESAAAWTRACRAAGTRSASAGFGP